LSVAANFISSILLCSMRIFTFLSTCLACASQGEEELRTLRVMLVAANPARWRFPCASRNSGELVADPPKRVVPLPKKRVLPVPPRKDVLEQLKKDFVFWERITGVLLRNAARLVTALPRVLLTLGFPPRVMLVELSGVIASDSLMQHNTEYDYSLPALLRSIVAAPQSSSMNTINLARCEDLLSRAFNSPGIRAVVLLINSPGGSPAQSSLIYQRLRALRKEHKNVALIAVVEDVAASGGYYIASAADEIIADPSSVVGSIGVISSGFGYVDNIKKNGITRRVHTAGKQKAGMDPFLRPTRADLAAQARMLEELHTNFIAAVKEGRGDRLKPEEAARLYWNSTAVKGRFCGTLFGNPSKRLVKKLVREGAGLFDGAVYSGEVGKKLGLIDRVGEMHTELQKKFGRYVRIERVESKTIDYSRLLRWIVG